MNVSTSTFTISTPRSLLELFESLKAGELVDNAALKAIVEESLKQMEQMDYLREVEKELTEEVQKLEAEIENQRKNHQDDVIRLREANSQLVEQQLKISKLLKALKDAQRKSGPGAYTKFPGQWQEYQEKQDYYNREYNAQMQKKQILKTFDAKLEE